MPHPVPIPAGPRPVGDAETAKAESFVAALTQIIAYGTTGSSAPTPRTDVPVGPGNVLKEVFLDTGPAQLFMRQLAVALTSTLLEFSNQTQIGITALSSDPADPDSPVALNAEEVAVGPGANLVPRARADGTIDPAWIGTTSGATSTAVIGTFLGQCLSTALVGDIVYVSAAGKVVRKVDITDEAKMNAVGCIINKPSNTSCVVQCQGLVSGVYSGLTAGKTYLIGTDGRPTLTQPVPAAGQSLFLQSIGIAVDTNVMLVQTRLPTKIRG